MILLTKNGIEIFEAVVEKFFKKHEITSMLQQFLDRRTTPNVTTLLWSSSPSGVNEHLQLVDGGVIHHIQIIEFFVLGKAVTNICGGD